MLRDSHSYETQIIDAVRSVNRALGGTYGTSSAIYKSEFNQYEVQLIDAIKGIGRTLSGKGLSVAGGDGASSAELQRLSQRVSKLESESFFRLVDGNVTLKEQYQNLWVPGWLSAGGIGQGGGGGGSSYLRELLDVYHNDGGILRGNGDPVEEGDVLVYDATDPDNPMWIAAAMSAAGTVTNYGDSTTGRIAKIGTVDIYNGVKWGAAGQTANTFTLTINGVTKTVALDGYGGGGGGTVTGYIGTTQVQSSAAAQDLTGILSINATSLASSESLIEWDAVNGAWHFLGNVYADGWVSAGGIGSPGGGTADVDLAAVWDSLTNAVADVYASTKINVAHIPDITTAMISNLETWIAGKNYLAQGAAYTLRTPVTRTAANGVLLGVDALSNAASSAAGSDVSRIEWNATLNAWHVYGNLYADGWVSAGGVGSGGSGSVEHLGDIGDVTLTSLADGQGLVWDATNSIWKNATIQSSGSLANLSDVSLSSPSSGQALVYRNGGWVNGRLYLTNLGDVDVTTTYQYDGYVLTYQNDGMKFVLAPGGGGGGGSVSYTDLTGSAGTERIGYITSGSNVYNVYTYPSSGGGSLSGLSDVSLSGLTNGQALVYRNGVWGNETISGGGGSTVVVTPLVSTGTKIATITVDGTAKDLYAPTSGGGSGSTVNWGTGNDYYVPLTVDNVTKNVLIGTGYVTLDTAQSISGAKTFTHSNGIGIGASAHTLKYNDSLSRFEFNGNLYVSGNIVASGSVTAGA